RRILLHPPDTRRRDQHDDWPTGSWGNLDADPTIARSATIVRDDRRPPYSCNVSWGAQCLQRRRRGSAASTAPRESMGQFLHLLEQDVSPAAEMRLPLRPLSISCIPFRIASARCANGGAVGDLWPCHEESVQGVTFVLGIPTVIFRERQV